MNCETCDKAINELQKLRREIKKAADKVNDGLYSLGTAYHGYVPVFQIDTLLVDNGFNATESSMEGADGSINESVGRNKYLSVTWHKMESGRYEVVAYLN